MQMDKPGNLTFKELTAADIPAIENFCAKCAELGYENNSSLASMKFSTAVFFGAFDNNDIISLAGVHRLPEVNDRAWRCLFRGAQLPGYTPHWSLDIFKSGIHFSQFLYRQIKLVQDIDPQAEFYISTNVKADTGVKSSRMNEVMMPRIAKRGIWDLHLENFKLYHVPQNLWKVNVGVYMEARERWLSGESYTD
jgi:hypothetical protein